MADNQDDDQGATNGYITNKAADIQAARITAHRLQDKLTKDTATKFKRVETGEAGYAAKAARSDKVARFIGGAFDDGAGGTMAKGPVGRTLRFLARGKKSGWMLAAFGALDVVLGYNQNGLKGAAVALADAVPVIAGAWTGAEIGVAIGGVVGSLGGPVGTVIGGAIGGFIGGGTGAKLAHDWIVKPILRPIERTFVTLDHPQKTTDDYIQDMFSSVGKPIGNATYAAVRAGTDAAGVTTPSAEAAPAPGAATPDAQPATESVPASDKTPHMSDVEGVPGVRAQYMLQSDQKENYAAGDGSTNKYYMAIFKEMPDPKAPGQTIWPEVGRVQDVPGDRVYRMQVAQAFAGSGATPVQTAGLATPIAPSTAQPVGQPLAQPLGAQPATGSSLAQPIIPPGGYNTAGAAPTTIAAIRAGQAANVVDTAQNLTPLDVRNSWRAKEGLPPIGVVQQVEQVIPMVGDVTYKRLDGGNTQFTVYKNGNPEIVTNKATGKPYFTDAEADKTIDTMRRFPESAADIVTEAAPNTPQDTRQSLKTAQLSDKPAKGTKPSGHATAKQLLAANASLGAYS